MIETEQQRRWWFATHPEYSSHGTGTNTRGQVKGGESSEKVSPEAVDAYVDKALTHVDGPLATFLRAVKERFGTEGASPERAQLLAAGGARPPTRQPPSAPQGQGRGRERRPRPDIRDWMRINRIHREAMEDIEAELGRAGANERDYVFVSFQGYFVARRDSTFDPYQRGKDGRTNIERMLQGEAPLDGEGHEIQLHHTYQRNGGPIIEMTRSEHQSIGTRRLPSRIDRTEFKPFRQTYWQARARALLGH